MSCTHVFSELECLKRHILETAYALWAIPHAAIIVSESASRNKHVSCAASIISHDGPAASSLSYKILLTAYGLNFDRALQELLKIVQTALNTKMADLSKEDLNRTIIRKIDYRTTTQESK